MINKRKRFGWIAIGVVTLVIICSIVYFKLGLNDGKSTAVFKKGAAQAIALPENLLLNNVTISNTQNGESIPGKSILIAHGKIVKIAAAGSIATNGDTQVIDASVKYVVPGFLNMHMHVITENENPSNILNLMLANGITGFRQMSGSDILLKLRSKDSLPIAPNQPALLAMPGDILMPTNTSNAEEARVNVQKQKNEGADFIKIGLLTPELFFTVLSEAKRLGIPALGHLPGNVPMETASNAGMLTIEHLGLNYGALLACSSDKVNLVKQAPEIPFLLKHMPSSIDIMSTGMVKKMLVNPQVGFKKKEYERLKQILVTYNQDLAVNSAKIYVKNATWQVPTMIRLRTSMLAFLPEFINDPNYRYVSAAEFKLWQEVTAGYVKSLSPEVEKLLQTAYNKELTLVKLYDTMGVKMLAGTDGGCWNVPGFSLHHEFDEFAKAGISPLHILQMATLNGAEYLHKTATMGTVEEGKNADLVLLDANPIESAGNLHKINAVVRAGYFFDKQALNNLKKSVMVNRNYTISGITPTGE
jgi:imidazolonepropionase-like amidohydrolase